MDKEKLLRNLPFGVVYYLESIRNENLNRYIKKHLAEFEAVMNTIPNLVTPYKLIYVKLCDKDRDQQDELLQEDNLGEQNIVHKNLIGRTLYKNGHWVTSSMSLENYFTAEAIDNKSNKTTSTFCPTAQKNQLLQCFKNFAKTLQKIPQTKLHKNILSEKNEVYPPRLTDQEIAYRIMNDVNTLSERQGLFLLQELYGVKIKLGKRNYQKIKYSRLCVDSEFNISLIDYDNQQVNMSPLMKTVYLLFLMHPEGIKIKEISDYEDDITNIYKRLTNKTNIEKIQYSIQRLSDPADNSLSEKLSFIKKRFQDTFMSLGISLSKMQAYVPQGYRGELYKITLDRSMIIMSWHKILSD